MNKMRFFALWQCLAICIAVSSFAEVDLGGIKASGYLMGSVNWNIGGVDTVEGVPNPNQFTGNMGDANNFMFNAFLLNLERREENGAGIHVELMYGRDVDSYTNFLGGGDCQVRGCNNIQEAYITFPAGKTTWTIGKFVTLMGVEVVETPSNPNITLGYGFLLAEPVSHIGAKVSFPLGKGTGTFAVVNGWDVTQDNNTGKTLVGQVVWPVSDKFTLNLLGNVGPEQAGVNSNKRTAWQAVGTLGVAEDTTLYFQVDLGKEEGLEGPDADAVVETEKWNGLGVWLKKKLKEDTSFAVRFERFDDDGGTRTGVIHTHRNLTLTLEKVLAENTTGRIEFRHDRSSANVFSGPALDEGTKDTQNLLVGALVYSF